MLSKHQQNQPAFLESFTTCVKCFEKRPQTFFSDAVCPNTGQRTEFAEPHFCGKLQGQSSVCSGRGRNERDIVSPYMWHSGSKFKDERSLLFRGYKVRCHFNCWSLLITQLTLSITKEQHLRCDQSMTINTVTSTFYEKHFGEDFNYCHTQNANHSEHLL